MINSHPFITFNVHKYTNIKYNISFLTPDVRIISSGYINKFVPIFTPFILLLKERKKDNSRGKRNVDFIDIFWTVICLYDSKDI